MPHTAEILKISPITKRIQVLYEIFGTLDYIGESISILAHSLQAANEASKEKPNDMELILSALFHDIGHILGLEANLPLEMNGCGIANHEHIGADFLLKLGFSQRIAKLVRSHVSAKRYLCYKYPEYHSMLTDASKTTLKFQGGVMSENEAKEFECDEDFENFLLMRRVDEAAKIPDLVVPSLESYFPLVESHLAQSSPNFDFDQSFTYILSNLQIESYQRNGFLMIKNLLPFYEVSVDNINQWTNEISEWEDHPGEWITHSELTSSGEKILCRSENFVDFHAEVSTVARKYIANIISQLFNETAVILKEKINHKQPGGAGFAAHQDTPAYLGLGSEHINAMIAIDDATALNGCLQVARGVWKGGDVELNDQGVLTEASENSLKFELVECKSGEVLIFSGFIPHRSEANRSNSMRRAMFLTYNRLSDGDFHYDYYKAKQQGVQGFDKGKHLSFQGDFQGVVI